MFLSIIIPIYNVEKYVRGTLASIYDQEFNEHEFEVICVNDGTPDNSMQIVHEFAVNHANLRVINQENQGLSCARNAGLKIAQGDYIWFVDSDDKVMEKSISTIKKNIDDEGIDVLGFDILKIDEKSGSETIEKIATRHTTPYVKTLSGTFFWHKIQICPAQRFLFRKKFFEENHLLFYPNIYYEDTELIVRMLCIAKRMKIINVPIYRYLVRSTGSIMSSSYKIDFTKSQLQRIENWKKFKRNFKLFSKQQIVLNDAIFGTTCQILIGADFSNIDFISYYKKQNARLRKNAIYGLLSMKYNPLLKIPRLIFLILFPNKLKGLEHFLKIFKNRLNA